MSYAVTDVKDCFMGATVTSGTATTVIWGPYNLLRWPTRSITLYNQGPATLSGAVVQVNPDPAGYGVEDAKMANPTDTTAGPNAAMWVNYDTTTFRNVAASEARGTTLPGLYRWWRVVGTQNNPSTVVSGYGYAASMV